MPKGKVYFVGAGPGDPGLVTLSAVRALAKADVVIYDFLANKRLLEYAVRAKETIYVGKKGGSRYTTQEHINKLLLKHAGAGKMVVRLKGGDPFVFGRGGEEALVVQEKSIPFEVIPGVSSAVAAAAYSGIPLTHRGVASSVSIITGQESARKAVTSIDWGGVASGKSTLVVLMGWKNLPLIVKRLLKEGAKPSIPVAVIRWGTLPLQKCVTARLDTVVQVVKDEGILPPVAIVVGNVVKLRERLNWFESRPLHGKNILVTRASMQSGAFAGLLEERGASVEAVALLKTVAPSSYAPLDKAIRRLASYDWAVFTSVNGVEYFIRRLYKKGYDLRELKGVRLAAIGKATEAALRARGLRVDLVAKDFRAEGLIAALKGKVKGRKFLLPRAEKAREVLPEYIEAKGGTIDIAPVYRTIKPRKEGERIRERLLERGYDVVTFTSSSAVKNFVSLLKKTEIAGLMIGVTVACIGPVTAEAARAAGIKVDIMPKSATVPEMAEAIADFYSDRS
ncbi:Uroporphyrinogen-III methyltransferase / Uroporphyrinogen-III synthase [hydrothermal vent metagenome]|uniref:uroporphyrinogen-III C-methyltransferase n=1 Tax=hydrothermal vent metagenome TaxID=652676 RepID=A0A3B0QM17_9ZZZZ